MKRLFSFLFLFLSATAIVLSQEVRQQPKVKFLSLLENVGTLSVGKGEKRTVTFVYENTGNAPLILTDAETSCGCTTVKLPKKPLKPGKKGKVKVTVNASHLDDRGVFGNLITITYNGSQRYTRIRVTGTLVD